MAVAPKAHNFAVMKDRKKTLLTFVMLLACCGHAAALDIVIKTQKEFDALQSSLSKAVSAGEKKVTVKISAGTYYYNDKHVNVSGWNHPKTSVAIQGQGQCVLVSKGKRRANGDKYGDWFNKQSTYLDAALDEVSVWSGTLQAADTVQILSEEDKTCLLPYKGLTPADGESCVNSYVRVTRWYTSAVYKIEKITKKGIVFKCDDLAYSSYLKTHNINGDYGFHNNVGAKGAAYPRFRLCNVDGCSPLRITDKVTSSKGTLYECRVSTFMNVEKSSLKGLEVSGITFNGNAYGWERAVMTVKNSKFGEGMTVKDNTFRNMKTEVLHLAKTDGVTFSANKAENCALGVLWSDNDCTKTTVTGNSFVNCNTGLTNTSCVHCSGTDFTVSENRFTDFGYCAVGTGVWWGTEMAYPCSGVISDNEMSFSDGYMKNLRKYTLMDSGAIYVATQTSGVVIENNDIHDYSGVYQNRGIFLDDGTCNCTVRDNSVNDIPNSYCIDLRKISYAGNAKNKSKSFNTGNVLSGNACDGKVRFETN